MGIPVMILGFSGCGKSASMRTLDPLAYSLIEVNGKPLPFRSPKKFLTTDSAQEIVKRMKLSLTKINVIDDSQYIMANAYMTRTAEKGFQKFTDIGFDFWSIVKSVEKLPPDHIVYFLHHAETDEFGNIKAKTIGKLLDEKICLEGMFTIVLRAKKQEGRYFFTTQSDGTDSVKSPMGMFAEAEIDNDLAAVDARIRAYYGLDAQPASPNAPQTSAPAEAPERMPARQTSGAVPQEPGKPEIPVALIQVLAQMFCGRALFSAEEQSFYIRMLETAGSQWVIQQAKNKAEEKKANAGGSAGTNKQ